MRRLPTKNIRGAYSPTLSEKIEEQLEYRTLEGYRRRYIKDLCDECLGVRYIARGLFEQKKQKNYKFICRDCANEKGLAYGKGKIPCYKKHQLTAYIKKTYGNKRGIPDSHKRRSN